MEPQREQRVRLEEAVERVLGIEVGVSDDVRRGHMVGQILKRREVIQQLSLEENRFGFEPEITAKVSQMDVRIYEVPISYYGRTYAEGKKINWRDGVAALWCIIKYNFFRRHGRTPKRTGTGG
jgi:hypothetical protein